MTHLPRNTTYAQLIRSIPKGKMLVESKLTQQEAEQIEKNKQHLLLTLAPPVDKFEIVEGLGE